ncbi:MAG: response regulator [Chitinispirillaceae bacterium]|nr:response regulator [Chitinispirillaceae bacterium]
MSRKNEPTVTISQPDKHNTSSRTSVEQHHRDTHAVGGSASAGGDPTPAPVEGSELLAFMLACVPDAVFALDTSGMIVLCNRAAGLLCGKPEQEVRGKLIDEVIFLVNEKTLDTCGEIKEMFFREKGPKERRCILSVDGVAERNVTVRGELFCGPDGQNRGMILLIRDYTQQEQLEEELLRVRKLESVGLLAGGIAHDFNNILTGIITNLFMARMSVYTNEEACQLIADAEKAAFKATRLTKQLLTFSQGGAPVKEGVSVCQLIEETVGFSLSGSNVDYKLHFTEDIRPVEVDKGQIDQVLNNLIINAAQAMPEGGTVTISVENCTLSGGFSLNDYEFKGPVLPLADGGYVKVSVSDEGPGIPKKHIGKIFDPYFTTKAENTGLGLTTAYSIIKKHGGHIEVESQPGHGAAFSFYLPAVTMETPDNREEDLERVEACGNILVMDDDVIIRTVIEKLLKKTGYNVVCVTNGGDALQTYIDAFNREEPFHFVIMDLTIPGGMGGRETVVKMKEFDKEARVVVFSGYSNDPILTNYKDYGFDGVLKKPFSSVELLHLIKSFGAKTA